LILFDGQDAGDLGGFQWLLGRIERDRNDRNAFELSRGILRVQREGQQTDDEGTRGIAMPQLL
jgi:hypothetical protein